MKNTMKMTLATVLVAMTVSGCATITRGTTDTLNVNSDPQGATVTLSNGMTGETPAVFTLPRNQSVSVTVSKAGCESRTSQVVPTTANGGGAAMAGNIIFGGVIGVGVDAASGATKDLTPNPLTMSLKCK